VWLEFVVPGAGIEPSRPLRSPGITRTFRPSWNGPKAQRLRRVLDPPVGWTWTTLDQSW